MRRLVVSRVRDCEEGVGGIFSESGASGGFCTADNSGKMTEMSDSGFPFSSRFHRIRREREREASPGK